MAKTKTTTCARGSIERHLDMCEGRDEARGDKVLRETSSHGNFHVDLATEDREGDEMSGDEHSRGLQGEEVGQESIARDEGMPGDESRLEDEEPAAKARARRRAG